MARDRLGDILIKAGLLTREGLEQALEEQKRWGGMLGSYLVQMGLISEETLVRALSTQYRFPAVALDAPKLSNAIARLVPRQICERHRLICFRADHQKKFLDIAMADPANVDAIDEVRVATRYNVRPHIAGASAVDRAINQVFYGNVDVGSTLDLSPSSPLRDEPGGGALGTKPASGGGSPIATPVHAAAAGMPGVGAVSIGDANLVSLPSPRDTGGFHITLDVPEMEKAVAGESEIQDRISRLERLVERDGVVLEALLNTLVEKGILSPQDAQRVVRRR